MELSSVQIWYKYIIERLLYDIYATVLTMQSFSCSHTQKFYQTSTKILICHKILLNTKLTLKTRSNTVTLQWIPGDWGIEINKNTDCLAKAGQALCQLTSYSWAKTHVHKSTGNNANHQLSLRISGKAWKDFIRSVPDSARGVPVAETRLITGHNCLANQLYRICIQVSSLCNLCKEDEVMDKRQLNLCSSLTKATLSDRYWKARSRIG